MHPLIAMNVGDAAIVTTGILRIARQCRRGVEQVDV
jgi:hypothetical protein